MAVRFRRTPPRSRSIINDVSRERRIAVRCPVSYEHNGQALSGEANDLSKRGAFVTVESDDELLESGAVVTLKLELASASEIEVTAKVVHRLDAATALALGRSSGMGFVFLEHQGESRARMAAYLDRLHIEVLSAPAPDVRGALFAIAHESKPLRRRIANVLDQIGCESTLCDDAATAFDACQEGRRPDCLIAQVELPDGDGFSLLSRLAENFDLVDIPVVLISADPSPIKRLRAYRLGAADYVPIPFTDEELSIRLRRAVALGLQAFDAAVLRGQLSDIPLPSLLTMFEFERKSGVLNLRSGGDNARAFLAEGRVLRVELGQRDSRDALFHMLDWNDGEFEFVACPVVVTDEIGLASSQLVLSHAQAQDEASARKQ